MYASYFSGKYKFTLILSCEQTVVTTCIVQQPITVIDPYREYIQNWKRATLFCCRLILVQFQAQIPTSALLLIQLSFGKNTFIVQELLHSNCLSVNYRAISFLYCTNVSTYLHYFLQNLCLQVKKQKLIFLLWYCLCSRTDRENKFQAFLNISCCCRFMLPTAMSKSCNSSAKFIQRKKRLLAKYDEQDRSLVMKKGIKYFICW